MGAIEYYTDEWTPLNPVILEAHRPQSDAVVATACSPAHAMVGTWQSVSLRLTLGPEGLRQGDALVVQSATRGLQSWPALQHLMPAEAGYTTADTAWGRRVSCTVTGQHIHLVAQDSLPAQDTLSLIYGDRRAGGPGIRMTLAALRQWFRILYVPQDGSGAREVIAEPPYLDLLPAAPVRLDVLTPSQVRRGEEFTLVVKAVDEHGNTAAPLAEAATVSPVIGAEIPPEIVLRERERAARRTAIVLTEELPPTARLRLVVRHRQTKDVGTAIRWRCYRLVTMRNASFGAISTRTRPTATRTARSKTFTITPAMKPGSTL